MQNWLELFPVRTGFSLSVMVLGMVIVFIGLIVLIGAVILASKIIAAMEKGSSKGDDGDENHEPAIEEPSFKEATEARDDDLIAVISAALAAFEPSGKRLVIRSVRRTSAWSDAGRREQLGF